MKVSPKVRCPKYALHRPTGQARVRIDGKDHYLGPFGSAESRDRYDDLVAEWLDRYDESARLHIRIDNVAALYLDYARTYYRKHGEATSELSCIQIALRPLLKAHGQTRLREFTPRKLVAVRQAMIDAGWVRSSINCQFRRILRMFRWAVENEYCPETIYRALCAVKPLAEGRCEAREGKPVRPVADDAVQATLKHLSAPLAAMVRLALLTGCRPGEICILRPCDLTLGTDGTWTYRPSRHKTEHHDRERRIFFGPQAQEILRPYLDRAPDAYCFTPAEAERSRDRKPRADAKDQYTKDSFRRAIQRACEKAFAMPAELRDIRRTVSRLPKKTTAAERAKIKERLSREAAEWREQFCWSPNQLRHSRATIIRKLYGREAAQAILGHSDPRTTDRYAEVDFGQAKEIMAKIG